MTLPVLEGTHVTLRAWRHDDAGAVREAATDPLIPLITTVPVDATDEAVAAFVERQWSRPDRDEGWPFAIEHGGVCVGACGVFFRDPDSRRATLGYWVVAAARRQGVAADAVATILPWAFEQPEVSRLDAHVEPWNTGSIRVLETHGFVPSGHTTEMIGDEPHPMMVFTRSR